MRFGLDGRALNGPESRALRTSLHLERRHLKRLVNVMELSYGQRRFHQDDIGVSEASVGYSRELLDVLIGFDAAVGALAARLHEEGRVPGGSCTIARPPAAQIAADLSVSDFGVVLDERTRAVLMGDEGDFWQRLFDAVVVRIAERCAREGGRLAILRPS